MASGIDGPGVGDSPQHMHISPAVADKSATEPTKFQVSFGDGMSYTPAASGSSSLHDMPTVTVTEPLNNHLSFSNLMAKSDANPDEGALFMRKGSMALTPSFQPRPSRKASSISDDIEKVLNETGRVSTPYTEPLKPKFDFGDPDIAAEVSAYNEQRFNEGDYSSHRRVQRHHSKPLRAHLSSHELKSIKSRSAAAVPSSDKEKKKSRRRHRSSSSSSSHGSSSKSPGGSSDLLPAQRKIKRKEKKKKSGVRKSLTAPFRQRTLSIPEEDEDYEEHIQQMGSDLDEEEESEEEEEEEEDEEFSKDPDEEGEERPDDDKGGDSNLRKPDDDDDSSAYRDKKEVSTQDGKSADIVDTGAEKMTAKFSVGDDGEPAVDLLTVPTVSVLPGKSPQEQRKQKKATFKLGHEDDEDSTPRRHSDSVEDQPKKKHTHKKHSHSHRHRQHSISQRRASGIQLRELDQLNEQRRRKQLKSVDGDDDIQQHRYESHPGIRKHLLHRPVKRRRSKVPETQVPKDKKPHEVFVELDELVSGEWKETARWIKFEEVVEESQKWGKPRVASLSFHSLLELRRTIEKGAVILDLPQDNLTDIANSVVEQMVQSDQIRAEDRGSVLKVLLSKHKHQDRYDWHLPGQTGFSYSISQASFSSFFNNPSSAGLSKMDDEESSIGGPMPETKLPLLDMESGASDTEKGRSTSYAASKPHSGQSAKDLKIMKKIPQDAEATAVLVGKVEYLEQPTMAFVRLSTGVDLENVVALPIPVRFLFVLLGPTEEDFDYHEIGRSISTLMADEEFHVAAYQADSRGDLLRAINVFLDDSIVLPPGQIENPELLKNIARYQKNIDKRKKKKHLQAIDEKKEPLPPPEDPLARTKKCFGGLIRDVKRRYPKYLSDITDAFNPQCLAAFIFIYFAALSPAITFGGLLGEKTNGLMGVSEMVVGCCACGCLMALFSGQPMLIVGATGPLLVFEEAVYGFCLGNSLPFLATRFWIGMWICIIAVITVAVEGSFLIRFVSRFTQEIFAVLISLIFIYETFNKLFKIFGDHPLQQYYYPDSFINSSECNGTLLDDYNVTAANASEAAANAAKILNQPNTALLSTLLMFGTYLIAMQLREFRNSKFLRSSVRRTIGDFGVPIAIFIMVLLDYLIQDTYTQKLSIPSGITPTDPSQRGWMVDPLGDEDQRMPVWMIFASILPAFLVFILIFMESHITELIVSKKERCLKKGTGFHLNILVLGLVNFLVSVFGMPWVCAAAVRSITHTNSLTVMSQTQAPGEKPKIEATLEQRVTCFLVNAALGLSILMAPILKEIPIAVLFGIFLYMGVTSLGGVQLVDRIELLFMPSKHYPDYSYVKIVRPIRMHIFTIIELICLGILWAVKSTAASIAFPFFLLMTVPLRRLLLPRIFTEKELYEVICGMESCLPRSSTFKLFSVTA